MRKLTQEQIDNGAKPVLSVLAYAGGLIKVPGGNAYPNSIQDYTTKHLLTSSTFCDYCKIVCDEIIGRNFKDVDKNIENIVSYTRFAKDPTKYNSRYFKISTEKLAVYIAWLCKHLKIFWDDSSTSTASKQEISLFKQTLLGQAADLYGCYTTSSVPTRSTKTSTSSATPRVAGQPQNNYKSTGPQSGNARDLKGQPGNKTTLSTVLRIITDDKAKHLFIKPLNSSGASGNTNKVMWGTAHGYTDCEVFFDNISEADAFLMEAINNNIIPATLQTTAKVVRTMPLSNGYFLVGTEFGDVYVSAKKFNENLNSEDEVENQDETIYESLEDAQNFEHTLPRVNRSYRKKVEELMEQHEAKLAEADEKSIIEIDLSDYSKSIMND